MPVVDCIDSFLQLLPYRLLKLRILVAQPAVRSELGHGRSIERDQRGEIWTTLATNDRIFDKRQSREVHLDIRGRDIFTARRDDDVLLAPRNVHETILVHPP